MESKSKKTRMDKEILNYKNIAAGITAAMLFLAIPDLPYGYYIFLRWVVMASALFIVWVSYNLKAKFWVFAMAIVALLFNPIVPVHLDKGTWVVIDLVVAVLFLVSIPTIKAKT